MTYNYFLFEKLFLTFYFQCELGKWRFKSKSQSIYHEGYMFPLLVTEQLSFWPEQNLRKRAWVRTYILLIHKKKKTQYLICKYQEKIPGKKNKKENMLITTITYLNI